MKGKTHLGVGIVTSIALYEKLSLDFNIISLGVVAFGSLLADIDHPKSMINKYILPFKNKFTKVIMYICIGIILLWYSIASGGMPHIKAIGILFMFIAISTHRNGLTHSLTGMIIFSVVVGYIGNIYNLYNIIYYFMIGYGSHLLCDMATPRGVPLFYPFKEGNVKLPITFRTNSKMGIMLENLIVILGYGYIVYKLPNIMKL
ncbi:membrane protein [Clostridium tetani]|uniref:Membrane protein n=1 Tax=Clostridium tetani TaxID=1513 RepID=A0A4Q0VCT3_CLOTA|nr:metal-dependent hydrolase [Clostridium tetani]RXI48229.1 metal-dependent hydrolase [Clostridium tetani]RXM56898.1 metal-dependent hydrolase [Clostridium tetani]RXM76281.1 metal-dependent hydrolase [Clostridium tetani]RYU98943.1 metal-dependent hydrolase [Clostridium tetani]BDR68238.1 membrane protein [Clostridium tetani]